MSRAGVATEAQKHKTIELQQCHKMNTHTYCLYFGSMLNQSEAELIRRLLADVQFLQMACGIRGESNVVRIEDNG